MTSSPLVTMKGTTTIPKHVRQELGIKPGDRVRFQKNKEGNFVIYRELSIEEVRKVNQKYTKNVPNYSDEEIKKLVHEGMQKQAVESYKRSLT